MLLIVFRLRGGLGGRAERQMKVVEVGFRPEAECERFSLRKEFFQPRRGCSIVRLKVTQLVCAVKKD